MMSPNFRDGGDSQGDDCDSRMGKYGPNETCTIELIMGTSPAIKVVEFDTEDDFDVFTVNDIEFSGSGKNTEALNGLVPTGTMTWSSWEISTIWLEALPHGSTR
jgi:hypothetical protein